MSTTPTGAAPTRAAVRADRASFAAPDTSGALALRTSGNPTTGTSSLVGPAWTSADPRALVGAGAR